MKGVILSVARHFRKFVRTQLQQRLIDWTQGEGIIMDITLPHTDIKNQGRTSHCWAYSMCSMMESELMAQGTESPSLNPLYFAAHKRYPNRHGGLPQTFLDVYKRLQNNNVPQEEWLKPTPLNNLPSAEDFLVLTSFSHLPYNKEVVLNVPDNYERFPSFNVKMTDLISCMKTSLQNGHTLVWEGDVHGAGYSQQKGLALTLTSLHRIPVLRSLMFKCHLLKDDHMLHIVGMGHNPKGQTFFLAKNSVGKSGAHNGYVLMSEDYIIAKTLTITSLSPNTFP